MNFSLEETPKISKDLILSRITEEQIMAFYLRINIETKKLFRSPLRNDKNPTCSLYRNKSGTLIFKDFATGQHLNCFEVVMTLHNCDFYKALKIIANDFNILKNDNLQKNRGKVISKDFRVEEKEFSKIEVEIQDFTDLELKWWEKYGITLDILKKYNVYSCKHVWLNGNLMLKSQQNFPLFGYYGKKYQGNELWRIYMPKTKNGFKFMGNWPSKKIQGYEQLPKKGKLLVITKSLKDSMVLDSLSIPSCSPNSETQFISDTILNELRERFENIVVLFDSDLTGITFMNKLKKKYPDLIYTWLPRSTGAKDISDFYKLNKRKKTIQLIKEFIIWLKNHKN